MTARREAVTRVLKTATEKIDRQIHEFTRQFRTPIPIRLKTRATKKLDRILAENTGYATAQTLRRLWSGTDIAESLCKIYLFERYQFQCPRIPSLTLTLGRKKYVLEYEEDEVQEVVDAVVACVRAHRHQPHLLVPVFFNFRHSHIGHANMLIYRHHNHTLEHFEPHGKLFQRIEEDKRDHHDTVQINGFANLFAEKIGKALVKERLMSSGNAGGTTATVRYVPQTETCPFLGGLQILEDLFTELYHKDRYRGFCSAWSIFVMEFILSNPELTGPECMSILFEYLGPSGRAAVHENPQAVHAVPAKARFLKNFADVLNGYLIMMERRLREYISFLFGSEVGFDIVRRCTNNPTLYAQLETMLERHLHYEKLRKQPGRTAADFARISEETKQRIRKNPPNRRSAIDKIDLTILENMDRFSEKIRNAASRSRSHSPSVHAPAPALTAVQGPNPTQVLQDVAHVRLPVPAAAAAATTRRQSPPKRRSPAPSASTNDVHVIPVPFPAASVAPPTLPAPVLVTIPSSSSSSSSSDSMSSSSSSVSSATSSIEVFLPETSPGNPTQSRVPPAPASRPKSEGHRGRRRRCPRGYRFNKRRQDCVRKGTASAAAAAPGTNGRRKRCPRGTVYKKRLQACVPKGAAAASRARSLTLPFSAAAAPPMNPTTTTSTTQTRRKRCPRGSQYNKTTQVCEAKRRKSTVVSQTQRQRRKPCPRGSRYNKHTQSCQTKK